jgi:anti-anti-sigma factor
MWCLRADAFQSEWACEVVMLRINQRHIADVTILDIEGRITPGEPELLFGRTIASVVRSGARKLLVNLTQATSMDTAGISTLVGAYVAMREAGGLMKLLKLERRYAQLLTLVALHTCFDIFESEEEALASFRATDGAGTGTTLRSHPRRASRGPARCQPALS